MKNVTKLLNRHRLLKLHLLIILVSFFSFQYFIERLLFPFLGMGWAYVIDQVTPLIIAVLVSILLLRKRVNLEVVKSRLRKHSLLLILIFIVALTTHLGTLNYFFWSDEVVFMLQPITQNNKDLFYFIGGANMRGNFITSYAFNYLVFGTTAWVYPLSSAIYFAISALFVYWFLFYLTNKKLIASLSSLFFSTTPIFLDMFTWHSTSHAPILIFGLISFIALLQYKKSNFLGYYIISLLFFFVAIKLGFVRSAGLTFIPLLLLLSPFFNKKGFKFTLAYSLPFIMISIYFCLFEFVNGEILVALEALYRTGNFSKAISLLIVYRDTSNTYSLFLPKLSLHTAFLFIPSGLAHDLFPYIRPFFGKVSIALILGNLSLLGLLFSFLVGLKHRTNKVGWLVLFAVAFIFLNMLHSVIGYQQPPYFDQSLPGSAGLLDERFAREDNGYGPGSRYLFISSVGISLFFGIFVVWLTKKGKIFTLMAVIFALIILLSNTYYTVRAQLRNIEPMSHYKSLVENIFRTVPRDGKPKILFSANPERNGLDNKFGTYIYGFYKESEIIYTKDPNEVSKLIRKGYQKENLYSFYNNPHTLSFLNISEQAREYFFSEPLDSLPFPLSFKSQEVESHELLLKGVAVNLVERAIIESEDINKQIIVPQKLSFKLHISHKDPLIPFSDTLFSNLDTKYSYNFPFKLWQRLILPPRLINNPADIKLKAPSEEEKQSKILAILQKRTNLMMGTVIEASNISNSSNINNITTNSLIDGNYTTFPNIRSDENFFLSKQSPVLITFNFPYITGVKRILLNTPNNYSANAPKKINIYFSVDGLQFEKISLEDQTQDAFSPNSGNRFQINLPKTIYTKFLRIELANDTKPVALDEIVIDESIEYSPKDIYETAQRSFEYIDSKSIFEQLLVIRRFNNLSILWACADSNDWANQLKDNTNPINGIWNLATVKIPVDGTIEHSLEINCYGAELRKVFFISPPYPVEMELTEAKIE